MKPEQAAGPTEDDFLKVCRLLNESGAHYLIVGGFALMMHDVPRFTADVDVLIEESDDNYRRVIEALSQLADGAAKELTPKDFEENLVVKIADEVQVDVSRRAWVVTYSEALPNALEEVFEGIRIPYLGIKDLIRSKQTYREKDKLDLQMLQSRMGQGQAEAEGANKTAKGCLGILTGFIRLSLVISLCS
jgi:hypothetical protein